MQAKLTLRIDDRLIKKAKAYSMKSGKSVSQLVTGYFARLDTKTNNVTELLPPTTQRLRGILKDANKVSKVDYYKYLENKYL